VTTNANAGQCFATGVALGTPGSSDNCSVPTVINDAPAQFPIGATLVHWTVTDASGNTNSCTQTVTVGGPPPPTITCPATVTTNAPATRCGVIGLFLGNPIITSNGNSSVTVTNNKPTEFPVGTNFVIWTATGNCSNSSSCIQQVIIRPHAPPIFAGLQTATAAPGGATLSWSTAFGTGVTYNVYQGTASGAENFAAAVSSTTNLTVFVGSLSSSLTYYFVVRATDACGIGETNTVERSVQPLASTNSVGPFEITAIAREGNNLRITWSTAGLGRTNSLQRTPGVNGSFLTNGFAEIFAITNTTSTLTNYLDVGAATNLPSLYYRVRLVP
jgi:hypothetical protein